QRVVFQERLREAQRPSRFGPKRSGASRAPGLGVRVAAIAHDDSEPRRVWDPHHPDADEEGYVYYPNVDVVTEMVDMISATRAYEANVSALQAAKAMAQAALDIGR